MLKTLVLVLIASIVGGAGHVMLSKGMKTIGDMTEASAQRVGGMAVRAVTNPWVVFGVFLQASFFAMYLMLLSRAEVSQLLPMTALDYIVVVFLAHVLLAEAVTPARLFGVGLITIGVLMVWRT
jgi:uncharacterized membrane protein